MSGLRWRNITRAFVMVCLCFGLVTWQRLPARSAPEAIQHGFTFSAPYAESLGLNVRDVYVAMLTELQPDLVRLPVYWDRVQPEPDQWRWLELDWQLDQAEAASVGVILAIGRRVPRWPECHAPQWVLAMEQAQQDVAQMQLVEQIVKRYRDRGVVVRWQVENEPYFHLFGTCPVLEPALLDQEIVLVRALDSSRPVMLTASGEQSLWRRAAARADVVGVSVYRTVYTRGVGTWTFPLGPWLYRARAAWLKTPVVVSEFQMEPWFPDPKPEEPDAQAALLPEAELSERLSYAHRVGFSELLFWGVEWWYWMAQHGHPGYWQQYQTLTHDGSL